MLDFKKIEEETLKFWKENQIYEKSKKKNQNGKKFYFLQGPPYTSGRLHIGHAWNNNMKDIALRFFRLTGHDVWDRAGYDMHGLPTENKVQKELNLPDKKAIIAYGLDKFSTRCMDFSLTNTKIMNEDLKRLGIWMDFDHAYLPVENEFMSSEWLLIKTAYEQKRLYKGKKVMQWCSSCETSLAKHELEYENVTDKSIYVKFKIKNPKSKKDEYLVIWTTTPWTIPFNLAIMANPDFTYVKVNVDGEIWIVAKELAEHLINDILGKNYSVIEEINGKKLEGLEYIHPFESEMPYIHLKKMYKNVHTVVLSKQYVTLDVGTGFVHCAPGCGPEDYEVGKEYGIDAFNTIGEKGIFEDSGKFNGWVAKKDDEKFIKEIGDRGALIASEKVNHEYAHCWRCHNPIVFRSTEQWFLKTEDLVKKIMDYNKQINWVPKTVQNSYESWITNLKDNGITRQRFWGTPVPIWECKFCNGIEVIGSEEELAEKSMHKLPPNLHKPWIDEVILKCPKCSKEMKRISDVIDVWIDSGTASWNCLYYPQRKEYFHKFFPADLIIEASEQAHLWFSMLQICSTIMFQRSCYNGVFGHGMILDFQGMKMSKSLGNIISPYEVIDKYSSEILRYYICETKAGENINFNWEDVKQKQRNLLVLMNTANYLSQLKCKEDKKIGLEEKYILSRLNSSIKNATKLFESFRFDETITELEKLYLDISRIYIKMTRDKSSESPGVVYSALKESYLSMLKMFATICPLLTESIWQQFRKDKIVEEESIHLTEWQTCDDKKIDVELEKEFEAAMKIIEAGLFARDKAQIGLKWPLSKATVHAETKLSKELTEIVANQLNVKKIDFAKSKEISVVLDVNMTPELEAEGYAREISRKVQALRKTAGLVKENHIDLVVVVDSVLEKMVQKQKSMIKDRTNSKTIKITSEIPTKKYKAEGKDKIKDKEIAIYFDKI